VTGDWYWEDGSGNNLDGTGYSFIDSDAAGSGATVAGELISPVIPCTGTVTLEFDQYYNYCFSDETATVDVWDGTEWQTVADFGNGGNDLGAWSAPDHQIIDISTYAHSACKIRFNYDDLNAWNWYWAVDNVTVTGTSAIGIKDVSAQGIKVFPNPSNGVFNINVENNYNLEVFDITGRVINSRTLTGNTSIELNTAGIYFLRFSNENGSYTQKVIVK
ncbi:MAG: T9SS type A sorting domain-containing protein, partial [Bacteroidales bacterium]|nr:T9SS type A sorting domain-containing protein [Bacteroidales bacterium]